MSDKPDKPAEELADTPAGKFDGKPAGKPAGKSADKSAGKSDLAAMRRDYTLAALDQSAVAREPFAQFGRWLDEAISGGCAEPNAMSLATVDGSGAAARPSARIVLLKGVDAEGLVFFTNYDSRKGREMAANPHAALLFHWIELEREVRVEGRIEKIAAAESDAYFATRPVKARIGAWASPQSQPIASREWLERRFMDADARYGSVPPRPPHWGGYRLIPAWFEFWQGRADRLHDRIAFTRRQDGASWTIARLAP